MQYSRQIEINLPRDQTAALFDDPDNLSKWMQGLVSFEHLDGEPGTKGARSRIMCVQGNREIEIIETIEDRVMPERLIAIYTTKGMWNRCEQYLEETPQGTTIWRQENEFRCSGMMMKLMTMLMPFMFKRETEKQMRAFKEFAEAQP